MIYTSYFGNLKNLLNFKLVSIAGESSSEFIALIDDNKFIEYKKLAPKYSWWKEWHDGKFDNDWYVEKYYKTVLNLLDPNKVFLELTENNTKDVVLLCWEEPNEFCHRHIVAKWLNENLNIEVKERI